MDGAGTRRLGNHRWRLRLMKTFLLGTVALVALGAAAPAMAADLAARPYTKAPAYAAPIYNWTGLYIGVHRRGSLNCPISYLRDYSTHLCAVDTCVH